MTEPIAATEALHREYETGDAVVHALQGVDVRIGRGELTVVHGRSGSGKTTLLNMIGGLDRPTARARLGRRRRGLGDGGGRARSPPAGEDRLRLPGVRPRARFSPPPRTSRCRCGSGTSTRARGRSGSASCSSSSGSPGRARHRPYELSGGEQQRVAIVRALANRPAAPDRGRADRASSTPRTRARSWRSSASLLRSEGVSAIVATHDPLLLDVADRVVELRDGEAV